MNINDTGGGVKLSRYLIILGSLALTGTALAGEAHVCKSQDVISVTGVDLTDSTIFTCGNGIKGTIPQLAIDGWKIVQQNDETEATNTSKSYSQIIIQKD